MAHDLVQFREALQQLQGQLQQASRPSRFKPPTDLNLVEIHWGSACESSEPALLGEIVDLIRDGMKIAVSGHHPITPGQTCSIQAGNKQSRLYTLAGSVRWVESHSLVTVFGILLEGD